jgi:UDP-N-acetylglucosamine 2-epimerase
MNDELALRRMQQPVNPYGDGHAALRIATTLERYVAGAMPAAVAAAAA